MYIGFNEARKDHFTNKKNIMTNTHKPDWIVIASRGNFLVVDNIQLQQDGIIAHALHSIHKSCESAQAVVQKLDDEG